MGAGVLQLKRIRILPLWQSSPVTDCAIVNLQFQRLVFSRMKNGEKILPAVSACSEPFEGSITTAFSCANCAHRTIYFDAAVAAYRGRGIVRDVIHEFKYNRQMHLRHLVGRWLCAALDDERLRNHQFDIIVPVPLHPARQRERGFNQASVLAELLSAHTSILCKPMDPPKGAARLCHCARHHVANHACFDCHWQQTICPSRHQTFQHHG